jgi:hypothetical protein
MGWAEAGTDLMHLCLNFWVTHPPTPPEVPQPPAEFTGLALLQQFVDCAMAADPQRTREGREANGAQRWELPSGKEFAGRGPGGSDFKVS